MSVSVSDPGLWTTSLRTLTASSLLMFSKFMSFTWNKHKFSVELETQSHKPDTPLLATGHHTFPSHEDSCPSVENLMEGSNTCLERFLVKYTMSQSRSGQLCVLLVQFYLVKQWSNNCKRIIKKTFLLSIKNEFVYLLKSFF